MSDKPKPETPPTSPAAPPAATVVSAAPPNEDASELVRLRQERETLAGEKKAREFRIAELEDENRRLKSPPAPTVTKKSWLDGLSKFFPDDE